MVQPREAALTISRKRCGVNAWTTALVGTTVIKRINGVIPFKMIWILMESVMCVILHPYHDGVLEVMG